MFDPRRDGMATVVRWEPLRELASVQNEMSRFMNGLLEGNGRTTQSSWLPAVDVWETDDELVYAFDLPGIPEEHIAVEFEDGALSVTAERSREQQVEGDRYYRFERRFGTFARTIGLPQGVTDQDIEARYEHGVLELHVRKPEQQKPKRINIAGASPAIEGSTS
jgi:HSP20 family protein